MAENKDTLERKLQRGGLNSSIAMETNLRDFGRILWQDYRTAKKKEYAQHLAYCMISRMYDENDSSGFVARQIHSVGELYSYTEKELLYGFRGFGKKSLMKLSDSLVKYGLPPIKLPQEWIQPS